MEWPVRDPDTLGAVAVWAKNLRFRALGGMSDAGGRPGHNGKLFRLRRPGLPIA